MSKPRLRCTHIKHEPITVGICHLPDPHTIIRKLYSLLRDDAAKKMIHRHLRLIDEYLQVSKAGFYVDDLTYLMFTLEYLAEYVDSVKEYKVPLKQIISVCRLPLLLEKTSSIFQHSRELEEYFTLLGYLIVIVDKEELQVLVIEIIQSLLSQQLRSKDSCVKVRDCQHAMEKSCLPTTVAELLEIASPLIFSHLLDITLLMVNASDKACHKMIAAQVLSSILLRMDPMYFSRDLSQPLLDLFNTEELSITRSHESNMSISCSILWGLFGSLKGNKAEQTCICKGKPSQIALWCLRALFRFEIQRRNVLQRNDLMGLILLAITVIPDLLIVESGLAEDLLLLSVASEMGTLNTWAEGFKFMPNDEDVHFKKLLLLSLCYLVNIPATFDLFRKEDVMTGILDLVNPGKTDLKVPWTSEQYQDLVTYALRVLTLLAPVFNEEFIYNHGPKRFLQMIKWYIEQPYDSDLLHSCLRAISKILASEKLLLLNTFIENGAILTLFDFGYHILELPNLPLVFQRILTHAFFILELLLRNNTCDQDVYGEKCITLVIDCCRRLLSAKSEDANTDHRLLIALLDLLWESIVWSPSNNKLFVQQGGVFVLLDTMQTTILPVKTIFLSALVDSIEQGECIAHLLTWRDSVNGEGYLPTLAELWREEETKFRVRRTEHGLIDDIELPLMGEDQWYHTFYRKKDPTSSPAIADIFGSVRPKIYSIIQVMKQRYEGKVSKAHEYYRLDTPISVLDKVTLELAENYMALKIGEVWSEVSKDLATVGVKLIGADGDVISVMTSRQRQWASYIQISQREMMTNARKQAQDLEEQFYEARHVSHLTPALEAMRELDYIARTSNRQFLLAHKRQQIKEVDRSLIWPVDEQCQHRTYMHNINVTVIGGENVGVKSIAKEANAKDEELKSVSSNSVPSCRSYSSTSFGSTEFD